MDALKRTLIEKAGHDFGFEYTVSDSPTSLTLGSARHSLQVEVMLEGTDYRMRLINAKPLLISELQREYTIADNIVICPSIEKLAAVFRRTRELAQSLPNQAEYEFEVALEIELNSIPDEIRNTEIERIVRQRVGQDTYRKAMLEYWGGACAVTGVKILEVLRASHAKPWVECESDAERLDVFNGFLLNANIDSLFDRFLVSFSDGGALLISEEIEETDREKLGLKEELRLRWVSEDHEKYLSYHRERFLERQRN